MITIYLLFVTFASLISCARTSSNVKIAELCETRCLIHEEDFTEDFTEYVKPFEEKCETEKCSQCLKPFEIVNSISNLEENCKTKCENCQQSCECKFNSSVINKPSLRCKEIQENESLFTVYLEWTMDNNKLPTAEYKLQIRNKSNDNVTSLWRTFSKIDRDVIPVRKLNIDLQYQFSVAAVFPNGSEVVSKESEWIQSSKANEKLMPPENATFFWWRSRNNTASEGVLTFDMPSGGSYLQERINLTSPRKRDIVLQNLEYSRKYTCQIMSTDSVFENKESDKLEISFNAPSCLEVHNNSFDTCEPHPPRSLQIIVANGIANISWKRPLHTSHDNKVINYYLTVSTAINKATIFEVPNFKPISKDVTLLENQTSIAFDDLHPGYDYDVSVNAVSLGGNSAAVESKFRIATKINHDKKNNLVVEYWILVIGIPMLVVSILDENYSNAANDFSITTYKTLSTKYSKFEVEFNTIKRKAVIGQGAFGIVYKAELNKKIIAVKMVKANARADDEDQLIQEIEILKNVGNHPNVVSLIACCTTRPGICLAVEYCPLGDLQTYLKKFREQILDGKYSTRLEVDSGLGQTLPESRVKYADLLLADKAYDHRFPLYQNIHTYVNWKENQKNELHEEKVTPCQFISYAWQIAKGMEYLANNRFIHRDLAARNILLASKEVVKISDFGLTRDVYERNYYEKKTSSKLPIKWMALESLQRQIYTTKSDVWSFGVTLWEITTLGGMPYPDIEGSTRLIEYLTRDHRLEKPDNCSEKIYQLMKSCWAFQPKLRPTFTELRKNLEEILEGTRQYMTFDMTGNEEYYKHKIEKQIKSDETNDSAIGG
uniref:receptor protein-tyrosine kinase n=1 Tax=Strigamia maritima TaxID=126957 RepID=T1JGL1_STRMM